MYRLPADYESEIIKREFDGQRLVPQVEHQDGPTCVLHAISYGAQMEMRRTYFEAGQKCDVVFDVGHFRYLYERETMVPISYDRSPRINRALALFKEMGVLANSSKFAEPMAVHLPGYQSYPPKIDQVTGNLIPGLHFDDVKRIIDQGRPIIGSFAVGENFQRLKADAIYDFKLEEEDGFEPDTHCVMFMDYGRKKGRSYLKFLNSHGPGFGEDGFGRVYFDQIYQTDSEYCFHSLTFSASPSSAPQLPPAHSSSS